MKWKVYSVKDELVGFNPPFCIQDNGRADMIAKSSFADAYKKGTFGEAAIDYTLYCLGYFDDQTGKVDNFMFPEIIKSCKEFIFAEKEKNNAEVPKTV